MKLILTFLIISLISTISSAQLVESFEVDGLIYETNNFATVTVKRMADGNTSTDINIPDSIVPFENGGSDETYLVTEIADFAFVNEGLTSVSLGNKLTNIGQRAFNLNKLTEIVIPNSVTNIGNLAFSENKLKTVTFSNKLTTIENSTFSYNELSSITIPNGVKSINARAFEGNQLTNVSISNSVTSIGDKAFCFSSTGNLAVNSLNTIPPTIETFTFIDSNTGNNNRNKIILTVPDDRLTAYENAGWTDFLNGTLSVTEFENRNNIIFSIDKNTLSIKQGTSRLKKSIIYNILGEEVLQTNATVVSISHLTNSVYILKAEFDKGVLIKKFTK